MVAVAPAGGGRREVLGVDSLATTADVGGRGSALDAVLVEDVIVVVVQGVVDILGESRGRGRGNSCEESSSTSRKPTVNLC